MASKNFGSNRKLVAALTLIGAMPALSQVNLLPPKISIEEESCQLSMERPPAIGRSPGLLLLSYMASVNGGLQSTQVAISSGDETFDREVQARLKTCRFLANPQTRPDDQLQGLVAVPLRLSSAHEPNLKAAIIDLKKCAPTKNQYPAASARNGEQGTTTIRFHVKADDRLERAEIASTSGYPVLDATAVYLLSRCQFSAATSSTGERIPSTLNVEYVWRLQ